MVKSNTHNHFRKSRRLYLRIKRLYFPLFLFSSTSHSRGRYVIICLIYSDIYGFLRQIILSYTKYLYIFCLFSHHQAYGQIQSLHIIQGTLFKVLKLLFSQCFLSFWFSQLCQLSQLILP